LCRAMLLGEISTLQTSHGFTGPLPLTVELEAKFKKLLSGLV